MLQNFIIKYILFDKIYLFNMFLTSRMFVNRCRVEEVLKAVQVGGTHVVEGDRVGGGAPNLR